jgi:hypothetical protein
MTWFGACHRCGHVWRVTEAAYKEGRRLQGGGMLCDPCIAELTAQGVTIRWAAKTSAPES